MEVQAIESRRRKPFSKLIQTLFAWLQTRLPRATPTSAKLDLEVMSDFMKRDLGFLDGRDPRQDSDLRR